jgi:hypothetical protein
MFTYPLKGISVLIIKKSRLTQQKLFVCWESRLFGLILRRVLIYSDILCYLF